MSLYNLLIDSLLSYFKQTNSEEYPIGISESVFETIIETSKSSHPNEFLCFLTGEPASNFDSLDQNTGLVITDFYIIPGTKSNSTSATVQSINIPVTTDIIGTLHSHPNGTTQPSPADQEMFRRYPVNIILGYPYTYDSWMAYSSSSEPLPQFPLLEDI